MAKTLSTMQMLNVKAISRYSMHGVDLTRAKSTLVIARNGSTLTVNQAGHGGLSRRQLLDRKEFDRDVKPSTGFNVLSMAHFTESLFRSYVRFARASD